MSKLGLHLVGGSRNGYGDFLREIAIATQATTVIKCVGDFGAASEAKTVLGADRVLAIGRLAGQGWEGFDSAVDGGVSPAQQASVAWQQFYEPVVRANPDISVWEPCNEWSNHWGWQADFYIALVSYFEAVGKRIGIYAFSTGNPPQDEQTVSHIARACRALKERNKGHILTVHEYGGVPTGSTLQGTQPYHALRYRTLYEALATKGSELPIVVSECGQNAGYEFIGIDAFIQDFAWYDSFLMQDDFLVGVAAWTLGNWQQANFQDALPTLAEYIIAHPDTEPPTMPPDPRVPHKERRILIHPQTYQNEKYAAVAWKHHAPAYDKPDDAGTGHSLLGLTREIWIPSVPDWDFDVVGFLNDNYPDADIIPLDVTPEQLDFYLAHGLTSSSSISPSVSPSPSQPPQTQALGIDVSHWQGTMNWTTAKNAGISFAFIKATEGTTFTDNQFAINWAGSKQAGIWRGAYHFYKEGQTPTSQAALLVNTVQAAGDLGDLPFVLDVEGTPTPTPNGVLSTLQEIQRLSGRKPLLYTNLAWLKAIPAGHPLIGAVDLWLAQWNVTAPTPPAGWRWVFWQYTSQGDGPTYGAGSARIDLDKFYADEDVLADYVADVTGQPPPPSTQPFTLGHPMPSIPLVVTHPFGEPRDYGLHEGIDLRAVDSVGNPVPVVACADGVVEQDVDVLSGAYGIAVVLRHDWPDGNVYKTWYAHLTSNDVSVGQHVAKGQRIGLSGTTGNSTGIHLHLNLQWMGHGLSGYVVPDVVDPAPYLSVTPPPPIPTKYDGWRGLGDAEGGPLLDIEVACMDKAGLFVSQGNQKGCHMWFEPLQEKSWEYLNWNGQRIPYARQLRRLDFVSHLTSPSQYVNGSTGIWDGPLWDVGGFGGAGAVLGNEMNLFYPDATAFCKNLLRPVIDLIRQHYGARYPNMRLISPPMSPQPNTPTWWDAMRDNGVFALCDGMGVHTYWSAEFHATYPMDTVAGGLNYTLAYPYMQFLNNETGGKLWITEASNNKTIDSDTQKGDQYARWLAKVPSDKVHAVFFFCVQGPTFDASRESWVRQDGPTGPYVSAIPDAFRSRWNTL